VRMGSRIADGPVYFAGDTGFGNHFAAINAQFDAFRLALLPIGGFKPEWFMGPIHMTPEEAVEAHRILNSQTSVACSSLLALTVTQNLSAAFQHLPAI